MWLAAILGHLLGDYVFQTDKLAGWKSRSVWGVLAHSGIVTLCTWVCSLPFSPRWWPYALLIGAVHAAIDVARTKVKTRSPGLVLLLFCLDQALHVLVITLVVRGSGWIDLSRTETALGAWLVEGSRLRYLTGYVLLSMPSWVLVHFVVSGTGAVSKSLPGRPGERYVGMLERGLIATFVLMGNLLAVPLVLVPRLAIDGLGSRVETERVGYLGEILASVSLAVAVGLLLRVV